MLKYAIPDISTEPNLELCQTSVKTIAYEVLEISKGIFKVYVKSFKLLKYIHSYL